MWWWGENGDRAPGGGVSQEDTGLCTAGGVQGARDRGQLGAGGCSEALLEAVLSLGTQGGPAEAIPTQSQFCPIQFGAEVQTRLSARCSHPKSNSVL